MCPEDLANETIPWQDGGRHLTQQCCPRHLPTALASQQGGDSVVPLALLLQHSLLSTKLPGAEYVLLPRTCR